MFGLFIERTNLSTRIYVRAEIFRAQVFGTSDRGECFFDPHQGGLLYFLDQDVRPPAPDVNSWT